MPVRCGVVATVFGWIFPGDGVLDLGRRGAGVMRRAVMRRALLIVAAVLAYAAPASASAPGDVVGWGAGAQHPPTPIDGVPFCKTLERAPVSTGLSGITGIDGSNGSWVALTGTGEVLTWGNNLEGGLGRGLAEKFPEPCADGAPMPVTGLPPAVAISSGFNNARVS